MRVEIQYVLSDTRAQGISLCIILPSITWMAVFLCQINLFKERSVYTNTSKENGHNEKGTKILH